MCLFTKWIIPKKASKDIVCYKILQLTNGMFATPYLLTPIPGIPCTMIPQNDYPLYTGRLDAMNLRTPNSSCFIHAYTHLKHARYGVECFNICGFKSITHVYVIVRCIIPKDTLYYKGIGGNICARKMNLVEIIE